MLNLLSVLKFIKTGVERQDVRFTILDDEHILDTKTGVLLHTYDYDFKMTYGDDVVAVRGNFTAEEQEVIWEIKELITDPVKIAERKEAYPIRIKAEREYLSSLFEHPNPIQDIKPVAEEDSEEYVG